MQVALAEVIVEHRNHLDQVTAELMNFRAAVKSLEKENEALKARVTELELELESKVVNAPQSPPPRI